MVADPDLFTDDGDGDSLTEHHLSLAKLVQDLVTTTEIYSRSVFGCAYMELVYRQVQKLSMYQFKDFKRLRYGGD